MITRAKALAAGGTPALPAKMKLLAAAVFGLVGVLSVVASPQTNLPSVTKVEPPTWWAKHTINPVRLLVRGKNLTGARVSSANPAIQLSDVRINRAGTYLFVNVRINLNARPGSYPLKVVTAGGTTTIPFSIASPLDPRTHFQGITSDDVIYLIMPDRFADGDAVQQHARRRSRCGQRSQAPACLSRRRSARSHQSPFVPERTRRDCALADALV